MFIFVKFYYISMGKEDYILDLSNKSQQEVVRLLKKMFKAGQIEKLSIMIKYKE